MKKDIHPKNYREVAFRDVSTGKIFIIKSATNTNDRVTIEGKEYPLYNTDTSSDSHPFYTGNRNINRSTGRVERFNRMAKSAAKTTKKVTN